MQLWKPWFWCFMRFYALQFTIKYKNQPCTAIFHSVIHLKHVKSCMGIDKENNILISFLAGPNVEISHHWLSIYLKRGEFSSLFQTENARIDLLYTPKLTKNPRINWHSKRGHLNIFFIWPCVFKLESFWTKSLENPANKSRV